MNSAIIHFSDKSTIELHEGDTILPVIKNPLSEEPSTGAGKPVELWSHIHNGLAVSIMDALCESQFFYINDDINTVYGIASIVKIEVI